MKRFVSSVLAVALMAGTALSATAFAAQAAPSMPGKMIVAQNYDRDDHRTVGDRDDHRTVGDRDDRGFDRDRNDRGFDGDRDGRGFDRDRRPIMRWHRGDHYVRGGFMVRDFYRFHLRRPAFGTHWVMVGNAFLLVSNRTGFVMDVVIR